MYTLTKRLLPAAAALILLTTTASAQSNEDDGPDPNTIRVRLGPLWMNPSVSIPNMGIDTNVFNDPPTADPKRDFTLTLAPRANIWLRMGRTWLTGTVAEDVVWYQKYTSERSLNQLLTVGWRAPLNRLVVSTGATWVNARTRPGFEIDSRVKRKEPSYNASAEVRGFAKTYIGARGSWRKVSYEEMLFRGSNLSEELDRTVTAAAITLRHELTPLTSVTLSAGRANQQFKADQRQARSQDYSVGFNFDPAALLKGSAVFGYTNYEPESADLPGYRGATVDVSLSYALESSTRIIGVISRSVEFSYDNEQPYYVQTGANVSVAQRIFGPVDLVGRYGAQRLAYESRAGSLTAVPGRTDRVKSYGGGVGFRLNDELRLGFNVDWDKRASVIPDREYKGLRYGTSLTYGL